jgi:hypothetical protein
MFLAGLTPAAAVSLGLVSVGVFGVVLAFAYANAAYFDPRRFDESDRAVPVLLVVGPVLGNVRRSVRDVALDAAALILLLTTSPKGAMTS